MPNKKITNSPEARGKYVRSEDTRARILSAAMEECAKIGFHKATMANIATNAGVAVGIINYHFGSRKDLLRQTMSAYAEHFQSSMLLTRTGLSFFEYEAAILETYLQYLRDNPNYVQLAEEIRRYEPYMYEQGKQAQFEGIIRRIEIGIKTEEISPINSSEIRIRAHLILGAYTSLDRLLEDEQYPGDDQVIVSIIKMLRSGLQPSPLQE
jgi:AcrR family transcriptional regulator